MSCYSCKLTRKLGEKISKEVNLRAMLIRYYLLFALYLKNPFQISDYWGSCSNAKINKKINKEINLRRMLAALIFFIHLVSDKK